MEKKPKDHGKGLNQIIRVLLSNGVDLFGIADLRDIPNLADDKGRSFPRAISFAVRMNPEIMARVKAGPNQEYADEYTRANTKIDSISAKLVRTLKENNSQAQALRASKRTDPLNIRGDFPHKTAATRAGLGWVGRNCQLITKKYGPWIRLGTVFIFLSALCDRPVVKSYCGNCDICVSACPAGALTGKIWEPGLLREELLDALRCDIWKKENYYQFHKGQNCAICAAVCPFGK